MRDDLNTNRMESIGPVFLRLLQWRCYFFVFAMGVNAACVGEGSRVHSRRGSAPGPEDQKHWFLQTLSSAGLAWDVIRFELGLDGLGELWVQLSCSSSTPGPENRKHRFLQTLSSAGLGWNVIRFGLVLDCLGEL